MANKDNYQIIKNYLDTNSIKGKTITQIAKKINVSVSALTRYAQQDGFEGFKDLKFYLDKKEVVKNNTKMNGLLQDLIFSLRRTDDIINKDKIEFIAKKIVEKGSVVFFGEAFTYITGQYYERKFRKINIPSSTLNVASDLGIIMPNPNAVYIFVSNSGQNQNIKKVAEKIRDSKVKGQIIFSITSNNYSNIEELANETVKGYFFENDDINPWELPSISNIVLCYTLDLLFAYVYNINKKENDMLIDHIKQNKEK